MLRSGFNRERLDSSDSCARSASDVDGGPSRRRLSRIAIALTVCLVGFVAACGGTSSAGTNESDDDDGNGEEQRLEPVALETNIQTDDIQAGQSFEVGCQLLDRNDNPVSVEQPNFGVIATPTVTFKEQSDDAPATQLTPTAAGDASVACKSSKLGLVDQEPVDITIDPGPAFVTRASLDSSRIEAGGTTTATCSVFDEFGNRITSASPKVELDAQGAGIDIQNMDISVTDAGIYEATCHVDGVTRKVPTPLEVHPGPPTSLMLATIPDRSLYAVSEVVRFSPMVTDEYGNRIRDAEVSFGVSPAGGFIEAFGTGRWEFNREGTYTIDASLSTSANGGSELTASTEIRVNSQGPEITCDNPADGGIVEAAEGASITVEGSVSDENGVSSVNIGGQSVSVNNGTWSHSTPVEFGVNFLDIEATDTDGKISSTTCAFLAADNWQDPATEHMSDAVSLKMTDDAFDDGNRGGSYNSIADMLVEVLNSAALENEVDSALLAQNPLYDDCASTRFGTCELYATVNYMANTFATGMSNTLSIELVNGGVDIDTRLEDLALTVDVDSETYFGLSAYDGPVGLDVDWIEIDLGIDISEQFGQIDAGYRNGSISVSMADPQISTNVLGGILDGVISNLASGQIKNIVRNQLKTFVRNQFDQILSDLFDSLDIDSFGQSFNVPSLAGSGSTTLDFGLRFSHVGVDPQRALIGIGTKFEPDTVAYPGQPDRVPLPEGDLRLDPSTNKSIAAGIHVGVLNHALHGLWRGGMFDVDLGNSFFGGNAPQGTSVALEMKLPPVADLQKDGGATVSFGGATVDITYPGVFDEPLTLRVGARAESDVQLTNNGTELAFQQVSITDFYFSPVGTRLNSTNRAQIEAFLKGLFQSVIDSSLNSALPAVPIPSFEIGPTFAGYLPSASPTDRLGLKNPSLGQTPTHFEFDGDFGLK